MPISLYNIIRIFLLIMPRPDHMASGKEMKRLPRKEAFTSMAPMETEATTGTIFIKESSCFALANVLRRRRPRLGHGWSSYVPRCVTVMLRLVHDNQNSQD